MSLSTASSSHQRRRGRSNPDVSMDIESIRARRAKLQEIVSAMRPPLLTGDKSALQRPFATPSWAPPQRRHPASDPTTPLHDMLSSQPPIPRNSIMTPYRDPLPGINKRKEPSSLQGSATGSRQCSGKRRTLKDTPDGREGDKRPASGQDDKGKNMDSSDINDLEYTQETIEEIVKGIGSQSGSKRLKNTIRARKLLSLEHNPPIKDFLRAGVIARLIPHMQQDKDSTLQYEATWALTNLAAGTPEQTRAVVDGGAVPVLIDLLKSRSIGVREQAAWALGNIAGDGERQRNFVVSAGIVPPLLDSLDTRYTDNTSTEPPVTLVRVIAWVLANLFRFKGQVMETDQRLSCIQTLKKLLDHRDKEVNVDTLWAIGYIADSDDASLQAVVDSGAVPGLVKHLDSGHRQKVLPALRATGNLIVGTDEQTDAVMAAGIVPLYGKLLRSNHPVALRRDTAWALSNLTAGTKSQIQCVVDEGILPDLVAALSQGSLELQREAAWALGNLTTGGTGEQIAALVKAGGVAGMAGVLAVTETATVTVALTTIHNFLKMPELESGVKEEFEAAGGVKYLKMLQQHLNLSVSDKATQIMENYFSLNSDGENEDEEAMSE